MKENMIVKRDPKAFYFNFDWSENVDQSLKHKTGFVIRSKESLAECKIKKTRLNNYF